MATAVELQNLEISFGAPRTGCLQTPSGLRLDLAAPLLGGPSQDALEAGDRLLYIRSADDEDE